MNKLQFNTGGDAYGTSLRGYVTTVFDQLVEIFGEPELGPNAGDDDDKVTCEWVITFADGAVATVYDWKTDGTPKTLYNWHIGGMKNTDVVNRINALVNNCL